LERLGDVVCSDRISALQVRDGSGDAEDPVVPASRKTELPHRQAEETIGLFT
jgi:hypothetical protein